MSVDRLKEIRAAESESDGLITQAEAKVSKLLVNARKEADELIKKSLEEGKKEAQASKKKIESDTLKEISELEKNAAKRKESLRALKKKNLDKGTEVILKHITE